MCKQFIWKVILGNTRREAGDGDVEGNRSSMCYQADCQGGAAGLSVSGDPQDRAAQVPELSHPRGMGAELFLLPLFPVTGGGCPQGTLSPWHVLALAEWAPRGQTAANGKDSRVGVKAFPSALLAMVGAEGHGRAPRVCAAKGEPVSSVLKKTRHCTHRGVHDSARRVLITHSPSNDQSIRFIDQKRQERSFSVIPAYPSVLVVFCCKPQECVSSNEFFSFFGINYPFVQARDYNAMQYELQLRQHKSG